MTNREKYKTPEERQRAFQEMCDSHKTCATCPPSTQQGSKLICAFLVDRNGGK
jgi:hypothetical protein